MPLPPQSEPRSPQPGGAPGAASASPRLGKVLPAWLPAIEVAEGTGTSRTVPLGTGPFRIGRAPSNELPLADDLASRTHAQIVRDGWDYVIEDLNSTNGILVNGDKVGHVSSGTYSPTLQKGLGMAFVKPEWTKVGQILQVEVRGALADAVVVERPFYKYGRDSAPVISLQ